MTKIESSFICTAQLCATRHIRYLYFEYDSINIPHCRNEYQFKSSMSLTLSAIGIFVTKKYYQITCDGLQMV